MSRTLLLALVAGAALILGAAPALADPPVSIASSTHASKPAVAADDDAGEDSAEAPDDDLGGELDDDDGDDGDEVCSNEESTLDGECDPGGDACTDDDWSDDDSSTDDEDGEDDELASTATDDDLDDDVCEEAAAMPAPRISKLHATSARSGHGTRIQVRFRLDRAGELALTLERVGAGARSSRRCAATPHARRSGGHAKAKRCARSVTLPGTVRLTGRAGSNATTLRRWKGKPLAPGAYRLIVTPLATGAISAKATFLVAAASPRR